MFLLLVTLTVIDSIEWWRQSPNQSIFEKVILKVKKVNKEHTDKFVRNFYERRTREMDQREYQRAEGKAEPREVYVFLFTLKGEQMLYPFMENNEKYLLEKN